MLARHSIHIGIFQLREEDVFFNVARLGAQLQRNTLEVDIPRARRGKKTLGGRLRYTCHGDKQGMSRFYGQDLRCAPHLSF